MDTEGLRLFVLAAELLNISSAGRQLGLAPAVASARLSKLENKLGADLLHRSTRKVSLSRDGAEFLPFAREILAQEEAALAAMGNGELEVSGVLRFAASSTFSQLYIVPVLTEFLERYPKIDLDLRLSDMQINLIDGGYDLALRNYPIEESNLRARKLADDTRILCASPDYISRFGMPETPDDLINHQIITFTNMPPLKLISNSNKATSTFPPIGSKNRIVCDDGTSIRVACQSGVGIAMNSSWSAKSSIDDGSLIQVLPDYIINDQSAIWLVYPKSNVLTAKVRVFIDFLLEKIGNPPIWER